MIEGILLGALGAFIGVVVTRIWFYTAEVKAHLEARGQGRDFIVISIDNHVVFEARVLDKETRTPLRLVEGEDE